MQKSTNSVRFCRQSFQAICAWNTMPQVLKLQKQKPPISKDSYSAIKKLQPGDRKLVSFNSKTGIVQLSLKSTHFKTAQQNFQLVVVQDIKSELETKELESWIKLIRVLTHEIMNSVAPITSLSQTISGYFKNLDGSK